VSLAAVRTPGRSLTRPGRSLPTADGGATWRC
jgi:hypothetical protein